MAEFIVQAIKAIIKIRIIRKSFIFQFLFNFFKTKTIRQIEIIKVAGLKYKEGIPSPPQARDILGSNNRASVNNFFIFILKISFYSR